MFFNLLHVNGCVVVGIKRLLAEHAGAVSQLINVAAYHGLSHGHGVLPCEFSAYPRDCSLRLLVLAVARSTRAFDVLMCHVDLKALITVLGVEVNVARQEVCRCMLGGSIVQQLPVPTPAVVTTASSAVLQDARVPEDLVYQDYQRAANVWGACTDAMLSQPSPWLTPGLSTGVTCLWLLLAIAQHSPLQMHVVLSQCPSILSACMLIVRSSSQAECFRLTRGSGIYGLAWRVLLRVVECDTSYLQIDTRRVVAMLVSGSIFTFTQTDELAVLTARTALAVMEDRVQSVLSDFERLPLARLLVGFLMRYGQGDDNLVLSPAIAVRRLVVAGMRLLAFKLPSVARLFLEPEVVKMLIRIVCSIRFCTNPDDIVCAERAGDILNRCMAVLSGGNSDEKAIFTESIVWCTNTLLEALETCLDVAMQPHVARRSISFLYELFAKWAPAAASDIVVPQGLSAHVLAIFQTKVTFHAKYNAAYLVRLLAPYTPLKDLQSAIPYLLQLCDVGNTDLLEMALSAITSVLSNPVKCVYFVDDDVCANVVRVALQVFVSHDQVSRATPQQASGMPAPSFHDHDFSCANAVVCIKHVISDATNREQAKDIVLQLLANDKFMHTLHIMAHPGYGCVPKRYGQLFGKLLDILVPSMEDVKMGRQHAVAAFLTAAAMPTEESAKVDAVGAVCCCICLAAATSTEVYMYTHRACRHAYHPWCLAQWLAAKDSCPSCRQAVLEIA